MLRAKGDQGTPTPRVLQACVTQSSPELKAERTKKGIAAFKKEFLSSRLRYMKDATPTCKAPRHSQGRQPLNLTALRRTVQFREGEVRRTPNLPT